LPGHLQVTFAVTDEQGRVVAVAKDPAALGRQFADEARAAVAAASPLTERSGLTTWDFGQLPEVVEIRRDGHTVRGFPTLLDTGSAVSLRIVTSPSLQSRAMVGGLRRLLLIAASPSRKQLASSLANGTRLALARQRRVELDTLIDDAIAAALDAITARMPRPVRDSDAFSELVALARDEAFDVAATALGHGAQALVRATAVDNLLAKLVAPAVQPSARDAYVQLERLLRPGFLARGGVERADDLPRYVAAIERRLTKVAENVSRDQARMAEVHGFERRAAALADRYDGEVVPPEVANLAWLLEEFRVHTFAQSLGARSGVSATKVTKELSRLGG
jgi:ATP-dependent helicase HrpA